MPGASRLGDKFLQALRIWGMYNISTDTTELPQNAGVAGSASGQQILNDSGNGAEYFGPCPPPNFPPNVHHYVI
jgi:phosphatidylethanolamine-binding protein (PEBP) family uncharacterized protein